MYKSILNIYVYIYLLSIIYTFLLFPYLYSLQYTSSPLLPISLFFSNSNLSYLTIYLLINALYRIKCSLAI